MVENAMISGDRCNHCENCTSIRALRTKGKACKIEMLGGHTYWVTSRYLEIDGIPRISEAVQDVSVICLPTVT
jgi:putative two-component system response regulator